ncbi:MAG: hypothetical protein KF829_03905 [Ferruginibacter sp.]|nr:hypothetical protein [Ferruginibacter sp.]
MKNLLFVILIFIGFCMISSCKKIENSTDLKELRARGSNVFPDITTYEKSFLVFESEDQLIEFEESLENSTYSRALEFLESLEFESLASNFSPELIDIDDTIAPEHYWDFIFGENGVVQIGDVIMKPIDDIDYILTLKTENFNQTNYENLLSENFDIEVMSKIATFDSTIANLFIFINENPSGYEATSSVYAPEKRRFWGWVTTESDDYADGCCTYRYECRRHYILGIPGKEKCSTKELHCPPNCS